ncbi:hypothetical protein [Paenibacillus sp. GP183]|uniref:hypothetical protein n=1 Tax=Paenibacillus sp. GP183 TaxID=1882751 RepID=UPI00089698EE|nr:hypothetical protein [Paenibacillus sp. GP183]SEC07901.1 hypothetical protein SAMN05443246_2895 [Paenibacillus sp. GP183]
MEPIYTKIGEHVIGFVCYSNTFVNWIRANFSAADWAKAGPDLLIHLTEGYGIPFVDYNVEITKEADTISFQRADYLIEADLDYRRAKVSVHDELALKHAMMNVYSSYLVYHQWGLLVHSSCVIDKGRAYMFAGHSGAGKSTAAKLSSPRELLSDEATVVKITPDQITVFNSPFRSELEGSVGAESSGPLGSIYILHQAIHNKRVSLSKSNGFLHLIDKVFYWSHGSEETKKTLGLLQNLVNTVPIYELHFQKNNTFWELISS